MMTLQLRPPWSLIRRQGMPLSRTHCVISVALTASSQSHSLRHLSRTHCVISASTWGNKPCKATGSPSCSGLSPNSLAAVAPCTGGTWPERRAMMASRCLRLDSSCERVFHIPMRFGMWRVPCGTWRKACQRPQQPEGAHTRALTALASKCFCRCWIRLSGGKPVTARCLHCAAQHTAKGSQALWNEAD